MIVLVYSVGSRRERNNGELDKEVAKSFFCNACGTVPYGTVRLSSVKVAVPKFNQEGGQSMYYVISSGLFIGVLTVSRQ